MKNKLKILFVSYECAPFVKKGGLADVALGLPKELYRQGVDIRIVIPLYSSIDKSKHHLKYYGRFDCCNQQVSIYSSTLPKSKVMIYFLYNKKYFERENIFGYKDDKERFIFFSRAVLEFLKKEQWQPDLIQANDWHTGAVPMLLSKLKKEDDFYKKINSLYTIHNLGYQGIFGDKEFIKIKKLGLQKSDFLYKKQYNLMAEGILQANVVNTVSGTYAREILTKQHGGGLEKVLNKRKKDLYGIVNGLDVHFFDPRKDGALKYPYGKRNALRNKPLNKKYLQKICKLPQDSNIPVFGMVSRLANQKGVNLLIDKIDQLVKLDAQFVFLGSGQKELEKALRMAAKKYPQKIYALTGVFASEFGRQIYAGSDFFLMPSKYEPCGLGQMIAMRYGTIPVVRATGGLKDTVRQINEQKNSGNGFIFKKFTSESLFRIIKKAVLFYNNKESRQKTIKRIMKEDWSWKKPAKEYVVLYRKLKNK